MVLNITEFEDMISRVKSAMDSFNGKYIYTQKISAK